MVENSTGERNLYPDSPPHLEPGSPIYEGHRPVLMVWQDSGCKFVYSADNTHEGFSCHQETPQGVEIRNMSMAERVIFLVRCRQRILTFSDDSPEKMPFRKMFVRACGKHLVLSENEKKIREENEVIRAEAVHAAHVKALLDMI